MTNYIIGAVVIAFIGMAGYCEVQKKQEIKEAIEKTRIEERNSCENMISELNLQSSDKAIKTIFKYEKVKSDVSNLTICNRRALVHQLKAEDFDFAD